MQIEYPASLTNGQKRGAIVALLKNRLDQVRFDHCLRVEQTARELAARFAADIDRAGLAGLLHDYAKQVPVADYQQTIVTQGFARDLLAYGRGVWHGLVGVWYIQEEVGITDALVLQAIARHTTGDPAMTALDQIVFVADFIEPERDLTASVNARQAAKKDLKEASLIELENTLGYLIARRKVVYPKTLLTYNAFIQSKE